MEGWFASGAGGSPGSGGVQEFSGVPRGLLLTPWLCPAGFFAGASVAGWFGVCPVRDFVSAASAGEGWCGGS